MKGKKTGGRTIGSCNKSTKELKEIINAFVSNNLEDMQKQYDSLDAYKKFEVMDKLMKYVLPSRSMLDFENVDIQINALPIFIGAKTIDLTDGDYTIIETPPHGILRNINELSD